MLNHVHIRPLRLSPTGKPAVPEHCGEVTCTDSRVICRREHDDRDCQPIIGCGAGRRFYCREAAHTCSRKHKCNDFVQ